MGFFDTVVAPITGPGPGAIAVVRLSGPESWQIVREIFKPFPDVPIPRMALYGKFASGEDGLVLPFAEGHSYTGEETAELSIHGSPASVRALLESCIGAGARMAEPGEFTRRAFLNGRLDLTQAEAVRETIEAQTEAQLRHASLVREGALHQEVGGLREQMLGLLAQVEASVNFPEEVGDLDSEAALALCSSWLLKLEGLLATSKSGRIIRNGLRIALVGAPNAGKSSLLNALAGLDRAIVTSLPGTTRDTIEETVELGGIPCVIVDTAGLREADNEAEAIGVERALREIERADLIWQVIDASVGDEPLPSLPTTAALWTILNKVDLIPSPEPTRMKNRFAVSALTGRGLQALAEGVREHADLQPDRVTIAPRHEAHLQTTHAAIDQVRQTLELSLPEDLVAAGLGEGIHALGQITGETATPDMIERIFRDFCVGK